MSSSSLIRMPIWILAVLAIVYTLYFARAVAIPIALSVLIGFLLAPPVRRLSHLGVPRWLASMAVVLSIVGGLITGLFQLAGPATEWMERLPSAMDRAAWRLRGLSQAIEDVETITKDVAAVSGKAEPEAVVLQQESIAQTFFIGTADTLATLLIMFVLIVFLLTYGDLFLRKTVFLLPKFSDKRRAVDMARQIEREISAYLLTITAINLVLGALTAVAMHFLGLGDPLIWGILAAVSNYIPYVGPLITVSAIFLASLITFTEWVQILAPPAVFLVLTALEGNLVTPSLVGRRMLLNPVLVFVALLLLSWLWGIPGALIAVPLLVVVRITCDRFDVMRPVAEYLSSAPPSERS